MAARVSIAVLYNQIGDAEYDEMIRRARRDPNLSLEARKQMSTVDEQIGVLVKALREAGFHAYAVNVKDRFDDLFHALRRRSP